jgi:protein ImuB
MTRRILSIWLLDLAIERWIKRAAPQGEVRQGCVMDKPYALIEVGARGVTLSAVNAAARALGLTIGMRLTDARAIHPGLATAHQDHAANARALNGLADVMLRFSPWTATDGADGLLLDVTGCTHLQGGEAELCETVHKALTRAGYTARLGLAETIGAASAAARFNPQSPCIIPPGQVSEALACLPLAALRIEADTLHNLRLLGLTKIAQLCSIDRGSLTRRFPKSSHTQSVLMRLDQALGHLDEPLNPRMPAPEYRVHVSPVEPLIDLGGIEDAFTRLLIRLLALLKTDNRAARRLTLYAFRGDGHVVRTTVGLARASIDQPHIARLFREKFDRIDPGFGIDTVLLSSDVTEQITSAQPRLDPGQTEDTAPHALERFVDKVANRLGQQAIYRLAPVESHRPERALRRAPPLARDLWEGAEPITKPRPLTLFERPEPVAAIAEIPEGPPLSFRWRRVLRQTARVAGPERLATEWWRELDEATRASRTRDYYVVEDTEGRRYWLFRDGLYDAPHPKGIPEWFVHGLFA